MDDQGRLWKGLKLIGEMTFAEKKALEKSKTVQVQGENRHERRKREAARRKVEKLR